MPLRHRQLRFLYLQHRPVFRRVGVSRKWFAMTPLVSTSSTSKDLTASLSLRVHATRTGPESVYRQSKLGQAKYPSSGYVSDINQLVRHLGVKSFGLSNLCTEKHPASNTMKRIFFPICPKNSPLPVIIRSSSNATHSPTALKSPLHPKTMKSWGCVTGASHLGRSIPSESLATENGIMILKNFLHLCR